MSESRVAAGVPTGGQFAASAKSEADVVLTDPATDPATGPLLEALSHLPGRAESDGPGSVIYTDSRGHAYSVRVREGSCVAQAEDVNAYAYGVQFGSRPGGREDAAASLLAGVQRDAEDIRAFNAVFGDDVSLDAYDGTITRQGVTVGSFTSQHPDSGAAALRVTVAADDQDPAIDFEVMLTGDRVDYVRNEDSTTPLTSWERAALEARVAQSLTHGGRDGSLGDLLRVISARAERSRD